MTWTDTRVFPLAQESAFFRRPGTPVMITTMTKNVPPRALDDAALSAFIAEHTFGALATLKRDGRPHLSTVVYTWDPETREIRVSTTEDRLKVKQLRNNPTASLYVSSADHWKFAVVEGKTELSEVTRTPEGERRLYITLKAEKLYGTALDIA
ncbi:Pyridoxine 5'-phosphate oxidase [Amycolatopsis azurea DSM 43854]|uniref:Pyridoxine 5'-phosphate oxidase n=2 Tax=Amycolatopsis azurea DSM 43854 TaxID=1238180 RepID=M2NID1_9PSEU|nr:Pyridoxine 5'-phosphate oxidase [Amycolatopsis azurea DSM 43854]